MKITQMSDSLSISPQVEVADLPTIAELGFQAIIINRPDGEGKDQPSNHDIACAVEPLGLSTYYIPVAPGRLGRESANAFATD